ncbi:hypothetical protein QOL99_00350 [Deinococcus sp. MIMF12]|uniref:Uncharacterized protein n=1 Tax=Deinococcus rhizophilus TaxID=3049544 RepID=A0ABT7JC31_9DEIO|nr:hypothetical protein [Deinococcus rhizophilus]MDL2342598.1 hypothetical protein [Deinococcus rhizophilus]
MRSYLRAQFGVGPLGLLLVLPLVLLAVVLTHDALKHGALAVTEPLRLLLAVPEIAAALFLLYLTRRIQDAVPQEAPREAL